MVKEEERVTAAERVLQGSMVVESWVVPVPEDSVDGWMERVCLGLLTLSPFVWVVSGFLPH